MVMNINEKVLKQNLNEMLFFEVFVDTLDNLKKAFDEFKLSINFKQLEEEMRRSEKLYEVMIEGGLIKYFD